MVFLAHNNARLSECKRVGFKALPPRKAEPSGLHISTMRRDVNKAAALDKINRMLIPIIS